MKTQILAAIGKAELQPAASLTAALATRAPSLLETGRPGATDTSR